MTRIVILECMQEISSFNPLQSRYEDFQIQRGPELLAQRGLNTAIGGALALFEARPDTTVVPVMSARAGSAGLLARESWERLSSELLDALSEGLPGADGIYVSLH